jgi:hypothetical protein
MGWTARAALFHLLGHFAIVAAANAFGQLFDFEVQNTSPDAYYYRKGNELGCRHCSHNAME